MEEEEPFFNYKILDTDYDNYTLIYSCMDTLLGSDEMVWILGRTPRMKLKLYHHV